jgi:hypothetical protein
MESLARALLNFSLILWITSFIDTTYGAGTFYLKEMGSSRVKEFAINNQFLVFVFIAPNCSACRAQIKEFSCINSSLYYLSLYGNENELFKEKIKSNLKNPLYLSNRKLLKAYNLNEKVTPQTLVLKNGIPFKHYLGFTECKTLFKNF